MPLREVLSGTRPAAPVSKRISKNGLGCRQFSGSLWSAGMDGDAPLDKSDTQVQRELLLIARMFVEYRDDPIMRELCRLAVKCSQEKLIKLLS